ncbi:uncharacterized protein [Manis javanica]|uniref:uncharacterized protein n=1 Tax=Manis javanica TaxID=9974 RepID=UPI003C6CFA53
MTRRPEYAKTHRENIRGRGTASAKAQGRREDGMLKGRRDGVQLLSGHRGEEDPEAGLLTLAESLCFPYRVEAVEMRTCAVLSPCISSLQSRRLLCGRGYSSGDWNPDSQEIHSLLDPQVNSKEQITKKYCCSSRRRGFPVPSKFAMNLMRLKKGKDKKLGEKGVTTFILTVVTGSLVNEAGSNVFPRPATGSAAPHRLNPLGMRLSCVQENSLRTASGVGLGGPSRPLCSAAGSHPRAPSGSIARLSFCQSCVPKERQGPGGREGTRRRRRFPGSAEGRPRVPWDWRRAPPLWAPSRARHHLLPRRHCPGAGPRATEPGDAAAPAAAEAGDRRGAPGRPASSAERPPEPWLEEGQEPRTNSSPQQNQRSAALLLTLLVTEAAATGQIHGCRCSSARPTLRPDYEKERFKEAKQRTGSEAPGWLEGCAAAQRARLGEPRAPTGHRAAQVRR